MLDATLPIPETLTFETVPLSLLTASALVLLKALLSDELDVPPLFAVAAPVPDAIAPPELPRGLPLLLSLPWSEWSSCEAVPPLDAITPDPLWLRVSVLVRVVIFVRVLLSLFESAVLTLRSLLSVRLCESDDVELRSLESVAVMLRLLLSEDDRLRLLLLESVFDTVRLLLLESVLE